MALNIKDGYTLSDVTPDRDPDGYPIEVVSYSYRPAMPEALYDWRYRQSVALSGAAQLQATAEFVATHLVRWDVQDGPAVAKITPDAVKSLPDPVLVRMATRIATWAGKRLPQKTPDAEPGPTEMEQAEKNSHTA